MKRGTFQRDTPQLGLVGVAEETNVGVGDEADFYPTPAWATHALLRKIQRARRVLDPCAGEGAMLRAVLQMYGDDEMLRLSGIEIDPKRAMLASMTTVGGGRIITRDALAPEPWPVHDLSLSNPPFKFAEAFVRRAIAELGPQRTAGGISTGPFRRAAVLLRLAFLESAERVEFHREHPADVYVFANRPQFIDPKAWRPCPKCKGDGGRWSGPVGVVTIGERTTAHGALREKCESCNGKGEVKGGTDSTAYAWFCYPGEGRWFVLDDRDPAKKPARRRQA